MRFNEDGDVTVISGVMDNGQGNDSMIAQIAAEELGIPLDRIKVVTGDTSVTPSDQGAYSQASTLISGGAVKAAGPPTPRNSSWRSLPKCWRPTKMTWSA